MFSTFPAVEVAAPLKKWAGLLAQVTQLQKSTLSLSLISKLKNSWKIQVL